MHVDLHTQGQLMYWVSSYASTNSPIALCALRPNAWLACLLSHGLLLSRVTVQHATVPHTTVVHSTCSILLMYSDVL
jgi:hypothetical protein